MTLVRKVLFMCSLFALTGCDNELQKAVRVKLIDPDSAKWGEQVKYKNYACLVVNSKNSYGGYTGNKTAWLKNLGDTKENWFFQDITDLPCYTTPLEEMVARDNEEAKFETEVVKVLNSKGYGLKELPHVAIDDKAADKCLAFGNSVMTSHRIFAGRDEGESSNKDYWLKKRDAELQELVSMDCKT